MEAKKTYKGFDRDMKCRGFQFEVGKTYEHVGDVSPCNSGFHSCENPLDVWDFYPPCTSVYAETLAGGEQKIDGTKTASASITVSASLTLSGLIAKSAEWVLQKTAAATGNYGHAAATGNYGHAAATGNGSHAAATGNRGHAAATGNYGHAAATGNYSHAAATGDYSHAAATGDSGHAAATGDRGHAAATGNNGIAVAIGNNSTAMAGENGWIVLAAYDDNGNLKLVKTAQIGGPEGLKPNVKYKLGKRGAFIKTNDVEA